MSSQETWKEEIITPHSSGLVITPNWIVIDTIFMSSLLNNAQKYIHQQDLQKQHPLGFSDETLEVTH